VAEYTIGMDALSTAAIDLVRKTWTHFVKNRVWPEKKGIVVELDEHGHDFEQFLHEISGISVQTDENGIERVVLNFDALVALPEGRDLFDPLPALIAAAVRKFSQHPSWADRHDPDTTLTFEEVVAAWGGDQQAALQAGVLMKAHAPAGISPSFNAAATAYTITPGVEVLRYRDATTLVDVLALHDYGLRTPPSEEERKRLVNIVFSQMREEGDWPNPIGAAIAIKHLGFVPDLVNALHAATPKIVHQDFRHFPTDRIELLLWSVTKLDDADYWKANLPRFVRAMYEAWKDAPGAYKPLSAVAQSAGLAIGDAVALALLTEHEPWARYQMRVASLKPSDWNLSADEKIRYLKDCATWDDYVRIRMEKWAGWPDGFGLPDSAAKPSAGALPNNSGEDQVPLALDNSGGLSGDSDVPGIFFGIPRRTAPLARAPIDPVVKRRDERRGRRTRDQFEFDVAVSFAGEHRKFVERVVRAMKKLGISVFYDYDQQHDLWGEDLFVYLDHIYRKKARFCLLFASSLHAKKRWTTHERKSAQARAFKSRKGYLLPVRMDDAPVPGLLETTGYLDARKMKPSEIAAQVRLKLAVRKRKATRKRQKKKSGT
jgi:hypothetical protein